jgi:hypothetical protein
VQPLLPLKRNKYYIFGVCLCTLSYPACNAHAPYCHLWPVRLYHIFPYYLINGTVFGGGKKATERKMCFDFHYIFVYDSSHSKKN